MLGTTLLLLALQVGQPAQPPPPPPTGLILGRVVDAASGRPIRSAIVALRAFERRFQFADVPPGAYTLAARAALPAPAGTARSGVSAPILWASTEVSAEGQSLSGVSLMLQPGLSVTGSVRLDGASVVPADLSSARVSLAPMPGGQIAITAGAATVDATGQFTISGVSPGRYRVNATFTSAPAWIYRSTSVGGEDAIDRPIEIRGAVEGLIVTFTDRPAQVDGKVQTAAGTPSPDAVVILFSADPTAWYSQSRRIRSIPADTDGSYSIKTLLPGDYLVIAVDDVEPGEWFDPAFLQRLVPAATKITIAEGEKKVQNVRVGGG